VWDTGNGDLGNQGIHQVDVARWGLGKDTMPRSVVGYGGRLGYVDDGETPNTHVMVLDYGDSQLIFETRGLKTGKYLPKGIAPTNAGAGVGNVFHGTDGYVVLTSYTGGAAFDKDGNLVTTFKGDGNHYRNFIDAVRSRDVKSLRGECNEGHLSSALCHLGNISYLVGEQVSFGSGPKVANEFEQDTWERFVSHLGENGVDTMGGTYRLGRKLDLNVKKETFKDGEANKHLSREYRKGFEVPNKA